MNAIKRLQERTPKTSTKFVSTQTTEISLKPVIIEPEPSKPTSPKLPKDFIKRNTPVYAVWFEDDKLVYEVC
jgi:hypothetical protein